MHKAISQFDKNLDLGIQDFVKSFTSRRHGSKISGWRNFLGLNPKGPYLSLEKEKENFVLCLPTP